MKFPVQKCQLLGAVCALAQVSVATAETVNLKSSLRFFPGTTSGQYFGDTGPTYEGCASGDTLTVQSKKVMAFPEELKDDVLFCLDASDRTGWETLTVGTTTRVTKIPSKYGSRTLSTEKGNWNNGEGWGTAADLAMNAPTLSEDAELGATVLDFGECGSGRALCFDAEEDAANYVNLSNIGTIVTLRGSQAGGGWLLGGGAKGGYSWHRGMSDQFSVDDWSHRATAAYDSPFGDGNAETAFRDCTFYADGQKSAASSFSFSGGWDLFAMQPTAATLSTLGLGMGDARSGSYSRNRASGGFKVAEMIIFSRLLDEEEIADVLAYLRMKWLGSAPRDYNGRTDVDYLRAFKADTAYNLPGISFGLNVPDGETLTVTDFDGGRVRTDAAALDSYGLTKTGAGTLALGDASGYGNRIDLQEGTLAFPAKPVPTSLGAFPLAEHFDASAAAATVETDDAGNVSRWKNASAQTFRGQELFAGVPTGATAPTLVRNALGEGLHAVDFGAYGSGQYLALLTNGTQTAEIRQNVQTVLAVIDAAQGGGNLLSGLGVREGGAFTNGICRFSSEYGARCYVNGVRVDPANGYPYPGWVVVAVQGQGASSKLIGGCGTKQTSGGLKIAELAVCKGYLSEEEILDASAYLADKWLGKALPGFAAKGAPVRPDVQRFTASAGTTVRVDAGRTARVVPVGPIAFTKTGAGTLEIVADGSVEAAVTVAEGAVKYVKPSEPASDATYAVAPALHVDPSRADTLNVAESLDGTVQYVRWAADASGGDNAVYVPEVPTDYSGHRPILNKTDTVNEHPVLDFINKNRYMAFTKAIDSVRSAFVVFGSQSAEDVAAAGPLLGWFKGAAANRNGGNASGANIPDFQGGESDLSLGSGYVSPGMEWFVNGAAAVRSDLRSGGYELIEAHPAVPAHAGGLQMYGSWCTGVARYGEILVYDRALTEREKVATRNYLLKKWFPDVACAELPAATAATVTLTGLSVDCAAYAAGTAQPIVVEGTLAFAAGLTVELAGLPQTVEELEAASYVIAKADGFEGVRRLNAALRKVTLPVDGWKAVATVAANGTDLVLAFQRRPGITLIIR